MFFYEFLESFQTASISNFPGWPPLHVVPNNARSSHRRCFVKKGVLRNFAKLTEKHLRQRLFFKKESLAQVFFWEFCEISKNIFSYRTPLVAASVLHKRSRFQVFLGRGGSRFLSKGGPYSEFSFQSLGNYSKEVSFLWFEKFLSFRVLRSTTQFLIITRN